jgi:hypothetical protein
VFTARYGLIPYMKHVTFRLLKVNINLRYPVVFKHYRPNVELDSTALCAIPGTMSSSNGHVILLCFMLGFPKFMYSAKGLFLTCKIKGFKENLSGPDCLNLQE